MHSRSHSLDVTRSEERLTQAGEGQPVQISGVSRVRGAKHEAFGDFMEQVPFDVLPGHSQTVAHGREGGHTHGDIPLRRFYVTEGAGRIHPWTERWRQRFEGVIYWRKRPRRY